MKQIVHCYADDKPVLKAKLETGEIVHYKICSESGRHAYPESNVKYIGDGTIYEIDGKKQYYDKILSFFY